MRYIFFVFVFLFTQTLAGQVSADLEKGDKAFDDMVYDEALYYYETANEFQPNNPDITRRIGRVYRRVGLPAVAAEWIKKTIELGSSNPNDMLAYAEVLKNLGQYDEAINWYNKYRTVNPDDTRAISHTSDPEYHLDLFADTLKYISKRLEINNPAPVIGVCPYEDKKLLIAAVDIELPKESDANMKILRYLDIYEVGVKENNELVSPHKLNENINTKYHDGPMCYDFDGKSLYITRNNIRKNKAVIDKQGSVNTKIYESKFINNTWTAATELSINNDDFSNAHPSITRDGNELYFSSNRPGGYGGMDIYVCSRTNEGWSDPVNLGPSVNTEGNEMFPFISNIGTLYFASDGHAGLGGLDIFFSEKYNGKWMTPLNMGVPLNGPYDDFSIYYDDSGDHGYFCSSRAGKGNDDIYYFQFKTLREMILAGNISLSDPGITLEGETVRIESTNRNDISDAKVDAKGTFRYIAQPGDHVVIRLLENPYVKNDSVLFTYDVPSIIKDPYLHLGRKKLELREPIIHSGPLKNYSPPALAGVNPVDLSRSTESTAESRSNEPVSKTGPETASVSGKETAPEKPAKKTGTSEFDRSVSIVNMDSLDIQNIYFDYNKSFIRDQDKSVLNKIIEILKSDEETVVLVKAHCDSRGNKAYNENLSMSRAFEVKGYLIAAGIPRSRMKINWYGEERLLNHCADEVPCSEEEYEINRRAEFKIIRKAN